MRGIKSIFLITGPALSVLAAGLAILRDVVGRRAKIQQGKSKTTKALAADQEKGPVKAK